MATIDCWRHWKMIHHVMANVACIVLAGRQRYRKRYHSTQDQRTLQPTVTGQTHVAAGEMFRTVCWFILGELQSVTSTLDVVFSACGMLLYGQPCVHIFMCKVLQRALMLWQHATSSVAWVCKIVIFEVAPNWHCNSLMLHLLVLSCTELWCHSLMLHHDAVSFMLHRTVIS